MEATSSVSKTLSKTIHSDNKSAQDQKNPNNKSAQGQENPKIEDKKLRSRRAKKIRLKINTMMEIVKKFMELLVEVDGSLSKSTLSSGMSFYTTQNPLQKSSDVTPPPAKNIEISDEKRTPEATETTIGHSEQVENPAANSLQAPLMNNTFQVHNGSTPEQIRTAYFEKFIDQLLNQPFPKEFDENDITEMKGMLLETLKIKRASMNNSSDNQGLIPVDPQSLKKEWEDTLSSKLVGKTYSPEFSENSPEMNENSPELNENTPELIEYSPELNENSPELSENSPELNENSPELNESSPELIENSPELNETSPELNENSPELNETSPELIENSPELNENSPELSENSPELSENSPELNENSPELSENSPELIENSPELSENSPELIENSPELSDLPELNESSPELSENSPELNESSPELSENSPELNENSPELSENSPELIENSPELVESFPKLSDLPELNESSPELSENSPELSENSPELIENSPELNENSPELSETSPELNESSPELNESSPELNESSPEFNESSPELIENSPELNESSPELNESSPELNENTPELIENSPEKSERINDQPTTQSNENSNSIDTRRSMISDNIKKQLLELYTDASELESRIQSDLKTMLEHVRECIALVEDEKFPESSDQKPFHEILAKRSYEAMKARSQMPIDVAELVPELKNLENKLLIRKNSSSAFLGAIIDNITKSIDDTTKNPQSQDATKNPQSQDTKNPQSQNTKNRQSLDATATNYNEVVPSSSSTNRHSF